MVNITNLEYNNLDRMTQTRLVIGLNPEGNLNDKMLINTVQHGMMMMAHAKMTMS